MFRYLKEAFLFAGTSSCSAAPRPRRRSAGIRTSRCRSSPPPSSRTSPACRRCRASARDRRQGAPRDATPLKPVRTETRRARVGASDRSSRCCSSLSDDRRVAVPAAARALRRDAADRRRRARRHRRRERRDRRAAHARARSPAVGVPAAALVATRRSSASCRPPTRRRSTSRSPTSRRAIEKRTAAVAETERADERILRSLQDSVATAQLRKENIVKAKDNAEFVAAELDRLENKIQALTEMAVGQTDPDRDEQQGRRGRRGHVADRGGDPRAAADHRHDRRSTRRRRSSTSTCTRRRP